MSSGIVHALERFVLPNACVSCGRSVERRTPDALVCGVCRGRMRSLPAGCARCRQPIPPVGPCRFCAAWPARLEWVESAVWLGDEARALVHHLKYDGYPGLAELAAELITRAVRRPGASRIVLTPIPLTPRRLQIRGYNQAALIARALAGRWRMPCVEVLLSRDREAGSQTELTPHERARNVAGAFRAVAPPHGNRLQLQRKPQSVRSSTPPLTPAAPAAVGSAATVILVDDVLTTGATIAAAALALAEAGWARVAAVSFARAPPFELRALLG